MITVSKSKQSCTSDHAGHKARVQCCFALPCTRLLSTVQFTGMTFLPRVALDGKWRYLVLFEGGQHGVGL